MWSPLPSLLGRRRRWAAFITLVVLAIGTTLVARDAKSGDDADGGARRERRETELMLGVATPSGPRANDELDAFEQLVGHDVQIVSFYQSFASGSFDHDGASSITARGAIPMVTWEPWDSKKGVDQPAFTLKRIASGEFDEEMSRFANDVKNWGGRVLLRFAHEMNGDWYPWSERTNGNKAGDYVKAWRHVHGVFERVGASNVEWVWSPNVTYDGSTSLEDLYPGDDDTDWVALDGYNFGTSSSKHTWDSFDHVFGASLDELERIAPDKPVLIAEVGCSEQGGDKAAWITDMFDQLAHRPDVAGVVWFDIDKRADWRLTTSDAAVSAFAAGLLAAAPASRSRHLRRVTGRPVWNGRNRDCLREFGPVGVPVGVLGVWRTAVRREPIHWL